VPPVEIRNAEPIVAGTGLPVAEVVRTCHTRTVNAGLAELAAPALDRASLEPILAYCAERHCKVDDATCPGCRLRMERLGINTLDDFIAHHAQIELTASSLILRGHGTKIMTTDSLEALAKTWAGEEYWFWARRVLRKLRHGVRRTRLTGAPPDGAAATPAFILVRPQLADNIGMVARALANFALDELRLVDPRDGWPNEKARIAASGANFIVDTAQAYAALKDALADLNWVAATSARQRDLAKPVLTPEQAVAEMQRRTAEGQRCGILFGPERNGLETEEVANADALVMAPVNPHFASLNLAQAALLVGYEWMKQGGSGTLGRVTTYEEPVEPGLRTRGSPPARKSDVLGFFEHLEAELDAKDYFKSPEKRPSMVQNMRTMFTRMGATEQEIRTLRGIVKALGQPRRSGRDSP
jgi:tRNA/rRNA methyltransferase